MRRSLGFTIPELLVAIFIFSIIGGASANLLFSSFGQQRRALNSQELLEQMSFTIEYMSRQVRLARKELGTDPLTMCLATRGHNFETTNNTDLKFRNRDEECHRFFLEDGLIKESVDGAVHVLSPSGIQIETLQFVLRGETQDDVVQPRVTFLIHAKAKETREDLQSEIFLQTTISQRRFDVPN